MTYKVLIADDQLVYASLIEKVLSSITQGINVFRAANGLEACTLCETELPNLILMDWEMPEMTGIEAVRKLKANPKTAHIPIFIVSSRPKGQFFQEAIDAGALDFIQKPFEKDYLLHKIERALNPSMA